MVGGSSLRRASCFLLDLEDEEIIFRIKADIDVFASGSSSGQAAPISNRPRCVATRMCDYWHTSDSNSGRHST